MTRIVVIGRCNIGATVGEAWRRAGHAVVYGSRSPEPPRTVALAAAIASAEVVLLAVPGAAVAPCRRCSPRMARHWTAIVAGIVGVPTLALLSF